MHSTARKRSNNHLTEECLSFSVASKWVLLDGEKMEGGHTQEEALFKKMGDLSTLLGDRWREAAVLLAGPSSRLMLRLVNSLAVAGLPRHLVLVSQLLQE